MYEFPRTAITKYHNLGGLEVRNVLSHSLGGWKSQIMQRAGWVPGKAVGEIWPLGFLWPPIFLVGNDFTSLGLVHIILHLYLSHGPLQNGMVKLDVGPP